MWYLLGHMFVIVISAFFHQGDVISLDSMGQWRPVRDVNPKAYSDTIETHKAGYAYHRYYWCYDYNNMMIIMIIGMMIYYNYYILLLAFICLCLFMFIGIMMTCGWKMFYRFPCWSNPILDGKSYELTMATIRSRRQLARVADDQHLHGLRAIHKIPGQDSAWVYHPVFSQYLLISHWYLFSVSA